ncbi:hypothetical protein EBN88_15815 [Streptomyces triticirhizae]|uniref:Uncharacterized protein n=1 Tax=Streptomyces triticirhizae TaxID=2483353 RepID=A0A3M2LQ22_9ACTN|nr:hypothetical protein EBN88_15815 [Streptomyces triticirhizae]
MSLGTLLQRGPDHLDLGVVQLGWASGGCPPPQGRSTTLLPHPPPTQDALGTPPPPSRSPHSRRRPRTTRLPERDPPPPTVVSALPFTGHRGGTDADGQRAVGREADHGRSL